MVNTGFSSIRHQVDKQRVIVKFCSSGLPATLFLALSLAFQNALAIDVLTDRLDLTCNQSESLILACSYRPTRDEHMTGISARFRDEPINIGTNIPYPASDSVTAILFLVDTSDPGRQDVITKNATQISRMLDSVSSHHIYGLAGFDKELNVSAPPGTDKDRVIVASSTLTASGLTTELYRNIIKAIELLGRANADRKLLVLFSDGQAEDKAYFHEDVINVARKNGVIINSLGFPRSTPLSVALQTLRRLSEETGGIYIESDSNFNLPEGFIASPFANADRGGHFIIDLTSITGYNVDIPRIDLRFESANGIIPVVIPVILPRPAPIAERQPVPAPLPAVQVQPQSAIPVPVQEPGYVDYLLWYGVPSALVILIVLTLLTLYMLFRKQQPVDTGRKNVAYAEIKPLAYLITQDEKAKRYPVTSSTWRIGRSLDNEMTIADSSISRRHAEIHRELDGQFVVYDRGSTNGVYVNNKKISKHRLAEGDIIEMGDIFLRFTQNPLDYQLAEDTAMLHTKAPV
jgi:hypothetical protein